jgi:hypothetical protein
VDYDSLLPLWASQPVPQLFQRLISIMTTGFELRNSRQDQELQLLPFT